MSDRGPVQPAAGRAPPWQTCLDVESQDAGHYNDFVQMPIFELMVQPPRRVLELGCAGGAFGAALKARYPGAYVVGIEAGRAAAQRAASRIDRVICDRLENVDFSTLGMRPGEFDTVIAADILEHLVNPWELLVRLRPWLAAGAQFLSTIPNVRNISVISQLLLGGRWAYDERGILDVTHLRFFTLEEIWRLFAETGYRMEDYRAILLPSLEPMYRSHGGAEPATINLGRMTLTGVTRGELTELCAAQFVVRARPLPGAAAEAAP